MIVDRRTWKVKRGCMQEAVALCKSYAERGGLTVRIYTSNIGPRDTLVVDTEFQSLAEIESFWKEWFARPDSVAHGKQWRAVTERGGTWEIWNLVE